MIVRLNHPWSWHKTLDVLDTEAGDLTEDEAAHLVRIGHAVDVDTLIEDLGGGWLEVRLQYETRKVRGRDAAIRALRVDSGQELDL